MFGTGDASSQTTKVLTTTPLTSTEVNSMTTLEPTSSSTSAEPSNESFTTNTTEQVMMESSSVTTTAASLSLPSTTVQVSTDVTTAFSASEITSSHSSLALEPQDNLELNATSTSETTTESTTDPTQVTEKTEETPASDKSTSLESEVTTSITLPITSTVKTISSTTLTPKPTPLHHTTKKHSSAPSPSIATKKPKAPPATTRRPHHHSPSTTSKDSHHPSTGGLVNPNHLQRPTLSDDQQESFEDQDLFVEGVTSPGCLLEDKEKFKRSVMATVYTLTDGVPTMLAFNKDGDCVRTLNKKGHDTLRSRGLLLPEFPLKLEVEAGMYMHNKVYLFDSSSSGQKVWSFRFNRTKHVYDLKAHSVISTEAFLQVCGVKVEKGHHFRVKAVAQLAGDSTCILYDTNAQPHLSENPSEEAVSLVKALEFLSRTEFVDRFEAIFTWLDEPVTRSVYVYGSNGELYELFKDPDSAVVWPLANYRRIPYESLPIPAASHSFVSF